eukprot:244038_1
MENIKYIKHFIDQFSKYYNISPTPSIFLSKLYHRLISYKQYQIFKCQVCRHMNMLTATSNTFNCTKCFSFQRRQIKKNHNKPKKNSLNDKIGRMILHFFRTNRGKSFDNKIFHKLIQLLGQYCDIPINHITALRYNNYSVPLHKKTYDTILKSFIGWIATIKCENMECKNELKLLCFCDSNNFQLYSYSIIAEIIGLKGAINDSLLSKLTMKTKSIQNKSEHKENDTSYETGTIMEMVNEFMCILPDKLKQKYFYLYKKYIIEWISFEFYNFECIDCGYINKTILINRIFEYAMHLNYCRVCHRTRYSYNKHNETIETIKHENINNNRQIQSSKQTGTYYTKYTSGISINYTILSPKYGSLMQEILLNDISSMSKESFNNFLNKAKNTLQNKIEIIPKSTESNQDFGIFKNDIIGICHLIVVNIYTTKQHFASKFNEAYWYWKDSHFFCDNLYYVGRFLYEAVYFFGQ